MEWMGLCPLVVGGGEYLGEGFVREVRMPDARRRYQKRYQQLVAPPVSGSDMRDTQGIRD